MGRKKETRSIDGLQVTVVQFEAVRGFSVGVKLGKALGPALFLLPGVAPDADAGALIPMIGEVLERLDNGAGERLMVELLAGTIVETDGKRFSLSGVPEINTAFEGNLRTMIKVCAFAAEVNFAGFFDGAFAQSSSPQAAAEASA